MMTAQQVIDSIHGSYMLSHKFGLRNITALMNELSLNLSVPVIHVAGTNGKGSTCAMVERILRCAGKRTGLYTSPFLQNYRERIRIDGQPIRDDQLARCGEMVLAAAERLTGQDIRCTPFELGTALAFAAFADAGVDAAVVQVGMGGRLDPTNFVVPAVSVIASIDYDHMQYLGSTLAQIAGEKAGIIKPGVPVVCLKGSDEVNRVFVEKACAVGAPVSFVDETLFTNVVTDRRGSDAEADGLGKVRIPLPGQHQLKNASLAIAAIRALNSTRAFPEAISDNCIRDGLADVVWPARLEWCDEHLLLDGAHNPQGIRALAAYVKQHLSDRKRVLLSGVLTQKMQVGMLADLRTIADIAVTVTPDTPRAMPAADYAAILNEAGIDAQAASSIDEGLAMAKELAGQDGIVIAAGSLYFAGALRSVLGLPW